MTMKELMLDTADCFLPLMKMDDNSQQPRLCLIPKLQMLVADALMADISQLTLVKSSCCSQELYGFMIARAISYESKEALKILLPTLRREGLTFMWNPERSLQHYCQGRNWDSVIQTFLCVFIELAAESKLPHLRVIDLSLIIRYPLIKDIIKHSSMIGMQLNNTSNCVSANPNPDSRYIIKVMQSSEEIPSTFYSQDKKMCLSIECGVKVGCLDNCSLKLKENPAVQCFVKELHIDIAKLSEIPDFINWNVIGAEIDYGFRIHNGGLGRYLSRFPQCLTVLSLSFINLEISDLEILCNLEFTRKLVSVKFYCVKPNNHQLRVRFSEKLTEFIGNLNSVKMLHMDFKFLEAFESSEQKTFSDLLYRSILSCRTLSVLDLNMHSFIDRNVVLGASQLAALPELTYLRLWVRGNNDETALKEMLYNVRMGISDAANSRFPMYVVERYL